MVLIQRTIKKKERKKWTKKQHQIEEPESVNNVKKSSRVANEVLSTFMKGRFCPTRTSTTAVDAIALEDSDAPNVQVAQVATEVVAGLSPDLCRTSSCEIDVPEATVHSKHSSVTPVAGVGVDVESTKALSLEVQPANGAHGSTADVGGLGGQEVLLLALGVNRIESGAGGSFDAVSISNALELAIVATVGVSVRVGNDSISAGRSCLDVNTEVESSGDEAKATVNGWVEVHSQVLRIGSLGQVTDIGGNSSGEVDSVELEIVAESPESSSLGSNVNRVEFSLDSGDSQQA